MGCWGRKPEREDHDVRNKVGESWPGMLSVSSKSDSPCQV